MLTFASKALPDHPGIVELKREVRVSSPTDSVLVFKGRATSAREAIAVSNAAADAYQSYSRTSASDQAQQVIAPLNERVTDLVNTNLDLQKKINAALLRQSRLDPRSQEYQSLSSQVAQWQNQLQVDAQELQTDRNQIANAEAISTANSAISVISPATAATNNLPKATAMNVFAGALAGLLLGTMIAIAATAASARPGIARTSRPPPGCRSSHLLPLGARARRASGSVCSMITSRAPTSSGGCASSCGASSPPTAHATATVVSLASDDAALAVAPQLASFAAGAGLRTVLVVGGMSGSVRALRQVRDVAALSGVAPRENLSVVEEMPAEMWEDVAPVDLVVRMLVTDLGGSGLQDMDGTTMLFAVSPSAATPEQIEAVADAALNANAPLAGIIIATPEPDDASARTVSQRGTRAGRSRPLGRRHDRHRPPRSVATSVRRRRCRARRSTTPEAENDCRACDHRRTCRRTREPRASGGADRDHTRLPPVSGWY